MSLKAALSSGSGLIPYLTLGDPSLEVTERLVRSSFENGADVVEIGIPFSDPLADGAVIQASHFRALAQNPQIGVSEGFQLVRSVSSDLAKPIVFMMSINLVIAYGEERFFRDASEAGLAGVIIPDLPIDEGAELTKIARRYRVAIVYLVSPLCTDSRLTRSVKASDGFIYLIADKGTTGARSSVDRGLASIAERIRTIKTIPVAVGFGISSRDHLETVYEFAEAGVVGSHLVKLVAEYSGDLDRLLDLYGAEIRRLKQGI